MYSTGLISLDGKFNLFAHTAAVYIPYSAKETTGYPRFIETGHQAPARIDPTIRAKIENTIQKFLDMIDQKTAPAHTEIKIANNEIKIIESQTRIGGDQIWEMTEIITGIDLMSETICYLLNMPMPERNPIIKAASIRFFTYENEEIHEISGLDEVAAFPNVIRIHCTLKAGTSLGSLLSSDSRQGYVLCEGSTIEEAIKNSEIAKNHLRVISSSIQQT